MSRNNGVLLFAIIMTFVFLSGCGNQKNSVEGSEFEIISQPNGENVDYINEITNYVGPYVNKDDENMTMFLSAEGENGAIITVDNDGTSWEVTGEYDKSSNSISYTNATKTKRDNNGDEETEYKNGKGSFLLSEDESIIWKNQTEKQKIVFQYNSEEHE